MWKQLIMMMMILIVSLSKFMLNLQKQSMRDLVLKRSQREAVLTMILRVMLTLHLKLMLQINATQKKHVGPL